ncbi:hypothetical protein Tco_1548649 [Tanacetum coccineum]
MEITVVTLVEEQMSPWKGPSTSSLARLELSLVVVEILWNEMKRSCVSKCTLSNTGDESIISIGFHISPRRFPSFHFAAGGKTLYRFGIGIPPGQGILCESTSRKSHFAVFGIVATRKYQFSSFKLTNETNSSFRTIEVERLATHKLLLVLLECLNRPIGGEISSEGKKCRESNIGDSDNTGDGGKIVGGAIGAM